MLRARLSDKEKVLMTDC